MTGNELWPEARQFQHDKAELGWRVADQFRAEGRAVQQRGSEGLAILIAKRIRAFHIRKGVLNNDSRDVPAVPVPKPPVATYHFNRLAGNSSL